MSCIIIFNAKKDMSKVQLPTEAHFHILKHFFSSRPETAILAVYSTLWVETPYGYVEVKQENKKLDKAVLETLLKAISAEVLEKAVCDLNISSLFELKDTAQLEMLIQKYNEEELRKLRQLNCRVYDEGDIYIVEYDSKRKIYPATLQVSLMIK